MRTLNEILSVIKADFVAEPIIAEAYGLDPDKTFDEQFSKVSLEGAVIYVFALGMWLLEQIFGTTQEKVEQIIAANYLCSEAWYQEVCLNYQDGHTLVYDPTHRRYGYAKEDPEARIVKYASVRTVEQDGVTKLRVMVSRTDKAPLATDELERFKLYMKRAGAGGIHYDFISKASDRLQITVQINYDPLLLDSNGVKISDGTKPVEAAIANYIDTIDYNGVFNKTRLIDAIQQAEGVVDPLLGEVKYATAEGAFSVLEGNSKESSSGSFTIDQLHISYLAQNEY
ncbi:MAG: hypothetical protein IJC16_00220 [Rikenellaceae bacterium]|nr:hypothetical protein [Rikenellaceae bacterium]